MCEENRSGQIFADHSFGTSSIFEHISELAILDEGLTGENENTLKEDEKTD